MTASILVVLAWTLLAMSTAFVIGHGTRAADAGRPPRSGGEMWSVVDEPQATPAS